MSRRRARAKARRTPYRGRLSRWARRQARQLARAAGKRARAIAREAAKNWRQYHTETWRRPAAPARGTNTRTRGTRPRASAPPSTGRARPAGRTRTMPPNSTAQRRTATEETEAIRRAGLGIGLWLPDTPTEVRHQLAGLSVSLVALSTGMTDWAEYLGTRRADPRRIVNPIIDMAVTVAGIGGDFAKLDAVFRRLYAGQLEQDQQPVPPMQFPAAA